MPGGMNVWDFTMSKEHCGLTVTEVKDILKSFCKKWGFQVEEGITNGYIHYQGRVSLNTQSVISTVINLYTDKIGLTGIRWSLTSKENTKGENFYKYVTKDETRIEGPWTDRDVETYIPKQYRGLIDNLMPWQQEVMGLLKIFDTRKVNIIFDMEGSKGKSTLAHLCRLHEEGLCMPICNDGEKLIQSCCNMMTAKRIRKSVPIFIDLPRAMDKTRLYGIYTAIEQIKSGYVYDVRNHYKDWDFDSPSIWVTTNRLPDTNYLTLNRWNLYIIKDQELIKKKFNDFEEEAYHEQDIML